MPPCPHDWPYMIRYGTHACCDPFAARAAADAAQPT